MPQVKEFVRYGTRPLAVLGFVGIALLLAAGPAAAHEGTTTTTPSSGTRPSGTLDSGTLSPHAARAMGLDPAAAIAVRSGGISGQFRSMYVLAALAATVAAAMTLRAALPILRPGARSRGADTAAAAALLFAGVAHCLVTPSHWAEGWHLGLFFGASGALLLGQGLAMWLRPSIATYGTVVVSTVAFIVLYFLGREFSLPLVGHRDPYLFEEYPVKVAEGVAAAVGAAGLLRSRVHLPALRLAAR